jgi:hypothetical protein
MGSHAGAITTSPVERNVNEPILAAVPDLKGSDYENIVKYAGRKGATCARSGCFVRHDICASGLCFTCSNAEAKSMGSRRIEFCADGNTVPSVLSTQAMREKNAALRGILDPPPSPGAAGHGTPRLNLAQFAPGRDPENKFPRKQQEALEAVQQNSSQARLSPLPVAPAKPSRSTFDRAFHVPDPHRKPAIGQRVQSQFKKGAEFENARIVKRNDVDGTFTLAFEAGGINGNVVQFEDGAVPEVGALRP